MYLYYTGKGKIQRLHLALTAIVMFLLGGAYVVVIIIIIIITIIIVIIIVSFMQVIHTHIPETNLVPRGYIVAAIPSLLFMVPLFLVPALLFCSFTLALSAVCVQCPIWLFSVVP